MTKRMKQMKKRTRRAAAPTPKRVWEEVMRRSVKRGRVVQAGNEVGER